MRFTKQTPSSLKFRVLILMIGSLILTACQASSGNEDILESFSQTDFTKTEAIEIECPQDAKFPSESFRSKCFQFKEMIFSSEDDSITTGVEFGMKLASIFKEKRWSFKVSEALGTFYEKADSSGCLRKVVFTINYPEDDNDESTDYPFTFTPTVRLAEQVEIDCT